MTALPNSRQIRQACALLARHLHQRVAAGEREVWLGGGFELDVGDNEARLARLRQRAAGDPAPQGLGSLRDTFVFGTGNPEAELVFVGEAPGAEEENRREPFVGPAGAMLDRAIAAMGLERRDVYITNIVKYRPKIGDGSTQGTANRKPTPEEMAACLPVVRRELAIIQPRAVVALGGTAYAGLTGDFSSTVSAVRGRFHLFAGFPMMATYHPSYLLRNPAKEEKRKFWEDLLMVMEKLEMPIDERQRGFFR
jgi:uracil-DNA glycosylase